MEKLNRPEVTNYRYITKIKEGLHVLDDVWYGDKWRYFKKTSLRVYEEDESGGVECNGLRLKWTGKSYPEYLSGR